MQPTKTLEAPYWPEPVAIISQTVFPEGFITVEVAGLQTYRHYTTTLPLSEWENLVISDPRFTFGAPAQPFRLAMEAERLRLAYSSDPLLAANNSRVHLLPHQMEAVYGVMLPQPRIRHLMAHDAGAGKTVMGGLLFKELASRTPELRTLIVAPAALTKQWQRELREKFLVEFEIVDRNQLRDNGLVWTGSARVITSLPFARQMDVQASLATVSWDLVLVDEAHHMAGYEKRETQAYRLGRILSRNSKHFVLATATPHKGDKRNFLKLLQLLDSDIHDSEVVTQNTPGQRGNPWMLRRLKEEMVDFDGHLLFKRRQVETRWHFIGENEPEMVLYRSLTDYASKTYRAAERVGGRVKVNTEFAMVMLQRRMASSFAALKVSLQNRRNNLLLGEEAFQLADLDWADIEEQSEDQRWQMEQQAELVTPARTQQQRDKEAAQLQDLLNKLEAVRQSGVETKVMKLHEILDELGIAPQNGEKLLVFTEFKNTLDFLRALFENLGYTVTQIDGSMAHDKRIQAEDDFHYRCQVMVATEAAGEGINLQFCANMINYDLPWVPTRLEQRMGRIHRYGQERVARIYNLVAADTREGSVLKGLMDRLTEMRSDMGDQVFDVISLLVSDVDMENWLAHGATAPATEAAQDTAIQALIEATKAGEARYKQWEEHPFVLSTEMFQQMRQASRQSRLTPEYAQHFFVDVLEELKEKPISLADPTQPPGDAHTFGVALQRTTIAKELRLPTGKRLLFTFREGNGEKPKETQFLALGMPVFDRILTLVRDRWGRTLRQGARYIDVDLAPGASYLLWFLAAQVQDGLGQVVDEKLFAVKQTAEGFEPVPAASLIDLIPAPDTAATPKVVLDWVSDPTAAISWSISEQQWPFLCEARNGRERITELRRVPMLSDAKAAAKAANELYSERAFTSVDEVDLKRIEGRLEQAKERVAALERQFEHEAACSLGQTQLLGVAAVFPLIEPPNENLPDARPEIAARAEQLVAAYEEMQGRDVKNVSGEHDDYPYDLHSTGPGGVRCIEVKGTNTGQIILKENQRRAAKRLGKSYYLYIVRNPLSEYPRLTIISDPLSRMEHDDVLHSGVRYVYNSTTWQAVADEETIL